VIGRVCCPFQQGVRRKKRLSGGSGTYSAKDTSGGKWLPEEDERLRAGVEQLGAKNWKRISEEFLDKRRTDVQCLHRWQKVILVVFNAFVVCQGPVPWVAIVFPIFPQPGILTGCRVVLCAGASARSSQRALDQGRRRYYCELHQCWCDKVVRNRGKDTRPDRQTVPRALVQSPGPEHQKGRLVSRRRSYP
jgi:hypothetical protein